MCPAYFMQPLGEFIKIALTAFLLTYPTNHKTIVALSQCDTSAFRMVAIQLLQGPTIGSGLFIYPDHMASSFSSSLHFPDFE